MKVLIVNTSERTGGAAVAAGRLMEALVNNGVKAKMLVRDKQTTDIHVARLPRSPWLRWHFLWERLVVLVCSHFSRKHLFEIDLANTGTDITRLPEFREADVVHLHWVNQGMLSTSGIQKILRSGKPVVWTMHDLWPATALCHYARGCGRYRSQCGQCPLLPKVSPLGDAARRVWRRKQAMLAEGAVHFVACSRWLEGEARGSALLKGQTVTNIPNAIDTRVFRPASKREACKRTGLPDDRHIVLFVSQRVTDERKGMAYFVEALRLLAERHPALAATTVVAVLGGHSDELAGQLPLPVHSLGYVSDEQTIVSIYNAAHVFVSPSLEDNLPNTIMEAMACGVPCVGFRVGGIPEMIDHRKNGYVAEPRSADDLARGMAYVLAEADAPALSASAVRKVREQYSQQAVALRYTEVYQHALAQKHFRL